MAEPTHLSLKVKLDDDIRRFSVQKDIAFGELRDLIAKHFVLAPENVQIKYIDDEEELITLGSDLELQEAKRLQPTVLRLNVYDVKPRRVVSGQTATAELEAAFVRDVTVPDGTNVTAEVTFRKMWRVNNSGSEPWPKGVVLKMVDPKDDHVRVLAVGSINRPIAPGEETDVGVELQAPSCPGRYVQYWRLFTADGEVFGPRLWLTINVTVDAALKEAEQRKEEEEKRRAAEEEEARLRAEEEEKRRAAEEEEARLRADEEGKKKRAAEERRLREEEEEKRRAAEEEEARLRAEAEERRLIAELEKLKEEEDRKRKQEEEELKKLEEERKQQLADEQLRRKKQEEDDRRKSAHGKYPAQLTALAEMGFTDIEHNVRLLDKHKGSLDLALEALLSGQ